MNRFVTRFAAVLVIFAFVTLVLTAAGCGCGVTGSEGDKAVNVSMGGKVMGTDQLSFKVDSYQNQLIAIRNTAQSHSLELGLGTQILSGNGQTAAQTMEAVSIPPGAAHWVRLSAPLQTGATYYLGPGSNGGKPTIRQLFICPGGPEGGGGGYNIPNVPSEPNVDIPQ